MTILIDTNVLLAAAFNRDSRHSEAAQVLRATTNEAHCSHFELLP